MAGYNEILEGGINRALVTRLAMSAVGAPAPSLAPEVFPMLDVFGGFQSPEMLWHLGWRRFAHAVSMVAVAAQRQHVRFRVQPNVNVMCVLEGVYVDAGGTNNAQVQCDWGTVAADLTNPFPNHLGRDFHQINAGGSFTNPSAVIISTLSDGTAATLGIGAQMTLQDKQPAQLIPPTNGLVLFDGCFLEVDNGTLNTAININFYWRERVLQQLEKAG